MDQARWDGLCDEYFAGQRSWPNVLTAWKRGTLDGQLSIDDALHYLAEMHGEHYTRLGDSPLSPYCLDGTDTLRTESELIRRARKTIGEARA